MKRKCRAVLYTLEVACKASQRRKVVATLQAAKAAIVKLDIPTTALYADDGNKYRAILPGGKS
jgi:hypothetical protein